MSVKHSFPNKKSSMDQIPCFVFDVLYCISMKIK